MALGVDYSWARPGGAAIKAAGFSFVCRYLATDTGKRISAAEAQDLRGNGLDLVLVFEDFANPHQNYGSGVASETAGASDAKKALAQANAIGFPDNRPIYFAVDYDATAGEQGWIDGYLNGAASVIGKGRVGVYGGYYVVKRCLDNGTAAWGWQAVAWSGGQVDPRAHIYQDGRTTLGGSADIDVSRKDDFGQWPVSGTIGDMADITNAQEDELSLAVVGFTPGKDYDYRNTKKNASTLDIDKLVQFWHSQSVVPSQQAQIQSLTDQLAEAKKQTSDGGFTATDRATLNAIQKAIASIFRIPV